MKALLFKISLLASVILTTGCTATDNNDDGRESVEAYPVQIEEGGCWSMLTGDGHLLAIDEFKQMPYPASEGVFAVGEPGNICLYKLGVHPTPLTGCSGLLSVGYASSGLIPVSRPGERISVVDTNGKTHFVLNPIDDKEVIQCDVAFADGMLAYENEDFKCGFIDEHGRSAIPAIYTSVSPFSDGVALVWYDDEEYGEICALIDKEGTEVARLTYSRYDLDYTARRMHLGVIPVAEYANAGFISKKGHFKRAAQPVHLLGDYNENMMVCIDATDNYGLRTRKGGVLINPHYDNLNIIPGTDHLLACRRGNYRIIDAEDNVLKQSLPYDNVQILNGRGFKMLARDGRCFYVLDEAGERRCPVGFYNINLKRTPQLSVVSGVVDEAKLSDYAISLAHNPFGSATELDLSFSDYEVVDDEYYGTSEYNYGEDEPYEYTYSDEADYDDDDYYTDDAFLQQYGMTYDEFMQAVMSSEYNE